ncbi:voltage-dependent T-type calcium channel subunit alpha-1H-like [Echeneis naucrates]|uniref:voltage-dependent T-type calcium channel subunit alpha-1H-like n=1 Tax=Echeneis naucrates TaxID=173247 RepID=UPI0011146936|nr:voltage-dependent T-type calcium channel subunit alpha-1H-like [Echeneis naucrates]
MNGYKTLVGKQQCEQPVSEIPRPVTIEGEQLPYPDLVPILDALSFLFFTMEMLIKMVALGVSGHERSYLRNNWNKLDVFIFFGELLNYFLALLGIKLNVGTVLKLMRLLSRVSSMRDLTTILVNILPMLLNVLILYILILLIFGIMGVQLWAGQLRNRCFLGADVPKYNNMTLSPYFVSKYGGRLPFICSKNPNSGLRHCHDVPVYIHNGENCSMALLSHAPAASNLSVPVQVNGCVNWNIYYNVCRTGDDNPYMGAISFDNIGYTLIALFQVVTLEGWTDIMFYVMDVHSFWTFIFFVILTIIGSFIMMNVCAVVIATKFSESMTSVTVELENPVRQFCKKLSSGLLNLLHCNSQDNRVTPSDNNGNGHSIMNTLWFSLRRRLRKIVNHKSFDRVIMVAVMFNIMTIAIDHHGKSELVAEVLNVSNIVFTIIFLVELVLKLLALKYLYFNNPHNIFDFVIVIISLWEMIAKTDSRLSILRAFRLLRLVRLLRFLPYLKKLLFRLLLTMKEGASLFKLLLFFNIIFSVIGMCLFGGTTHSGSAVNDRMNFDSMLWSMVTILTGEDWNLVMYNAMDATSPWAFFYFFTIIVGGRHVLLNILVGIVVKTFQDMDTSVENASSTDTESSLSQNEENNVEKINSAQTLQHWCRKHRDWSFFVLSPQNRFRIVCQRLISHSVFDHLILLLILLSCVTLALERPEIDPRSMERQILSISNYIFSAIFLVEMLIKVVAKGFVYGDNSYCQSCWDVMDGLLVILSLVTIILPLVSSGASSNLGILKVLRLFRAFRPLRVIKRAPKLKLAVKALMASFKPIGNIVVICCILFLCYGLIGVQLFKGKFYHCVGEDLRNITNKDECLSADFQWVEKPFNFNNLLQALITLFVMFSRDGWVNIMYDGLDAVEVDQQPVRNYNEWMVLYFISFLILSFFLLDMFIGVMVETFHECQQEQKRLDEIERENGTEQDEPIAEQIPYCRDYSSIRRFVYKLCSSKGLDLFMTVTIIANVLVMAAEHYQQPQYVEDLLEYSYYMFTAILSTEVLLKLVAFGIRRFMVVRWNLLDVFIVLVSIITIILDQMKMEYVVPVNPSILRVCRALRLAQVLKARRIRVLLKTIVKTLSQVGNICLLFLFFFFIYAVLGVELFGRLECSDDHPCQGLHRYFNFKHFGIAILTLYQVCTGDNWSGILKDTMRECRPNDAGCSSYMPWIAPIYFSSFVIMAQFVLVNLVVATIAQALDDSREEEMMLEAEQALQSPDESITITDALHAGALDQIRIHRSSESLGSLGE